MRTRIFNGAVVVLAWLSVSPIVQGGEAIRKRLDNGLGVLLYPTEETQQVALLVLYSIGDEHDPAGKCGLSHMVEHVYVTAAAGDTPARTAQEFMSKYPGKWNAQTGPDYSVFSTVFPKAQLEDEVREAGSRMGDLRISQANFDRERPRVLEELVNMYGWSPSVAAINHARERIRPMEGYRRGGVWEHIEKMTLDGVSGWWSDYYKPCNAMVILAGAFDAQVAQELISKYFGSIASGKKVPEKRKPGPPQTGRVDVVQSPVAIGDVPAQACIAFAAPAPGTEHYAATLLLVSRMWTMAADRSADTTVLFNILDDPAMIAFRTQVVPEESNENAIARIRLFIDQALTRPLHNVEPIAFRENLGAMLGVVEMPPTFIKSNLYGAAFALGRREQLGFDSAKLGAEVEAMTRDELQAGKEAVFGEARQATVLVGPAK